MAKSYTMQIYDDTIAKVLCKLKDVDSIEIQSKDENIDRNYDCWKGKPDWLEYEIYVDGSVEKATYMTLNLPRYFAKSWANNYANEDTNIVLANEKANERLQEIFFDNNMFGKFNNFVEGFMALGCGAMIVNVDKQMTDKKGNVYPSPNANVKINFVGGRRIIPITINDGEMTELAFINYGTNDLSLVIHYINKNGFYSVAEIKGKKDDKGVPTFDFENISNYDTQSVDPLFVYWKPNLCEDDDVENGTGISIYEGAYDTFKQCDMAYTSLWKELKLGQKQIFVSSDIEIVKKGADGKAVHLNPLGQREGITSVPSGTDGSTLIQEFNGQLRVEQLIRTLEFHMNTGAMLCGLGQATFEFSQGRPLQTATAVISKKDELYRNVMKQENFARDRFRKLVKAIAYVNDSMTSKPKIGDFKLSEIEITFDDNISEDTASKKQNDLSLVNAGIMTIAEYRDAWFDEGENTADEFVKENGLLALKYLPLLQAGAISPEHYCELVYADNRDVEYIKEQMQGAMIDNPQDENESNFNSTNDDVDDEDDVEGE